MAEPPTTIRNSWEAEMFRLLVENVRDYAIFVVDSQRRVLSWSQAAERMLGYTESEILGESADLFFTPEDLSRGEPERELASALATGRGMDDRWHVHKDGHRFWCNGVVTPLWDEAGNLRGFAKIMRDLTERKLAEDVLFQLAAVVESAVDAVFSCKIDGTVTQWNSAAERLLGYRRTEIIGQPVTLLVPCDRREEMGSIAERLRTGERIEHFETVLARKDGQRCDFSVTMSPMKDARDIVTGISVVARDITELKRTEQRRALRLEITQILAEDISLSQAAPRMLQAICETLDWDVGALWVTDREANVIRCFELWHRPGLQIPAFEKASRQASFPPNGSLPGRVWANRAPLGVADFASDVRFDRAAVAARDGLHSAFACPIVLESEVLGVIEFFGREVREPDADVSEITLTIGGQIGQFMERRRAVATLRANEESLRLALDAGRMGTWDWDIATNRLSWSDNLEPIHGLEPGTFAGTFEAFANLIHPDDRPRVVDTITRTLEQCGSFDIEFRNVWPDGSVHWLTGKGKVFTNRAGEPVRMVGVGMDITDRKHLEQQLRQRVEELAKAEERVRSVVDHAIDGIITIDATGRVETMNPAAERIFGYRAEEVIGRNVNMLMPQPFAVEHDSYLRNYLQSGQAKVIGIGREVMGLRKDGSTFPVDLAVSEFHLGSERYFTGIVRDITERKEATRALMMQSRVLESMTEGVTLSDENGVIRYSNRAEDRMFGYEPGELIGQRVTVQNNYPPEENERLVQEVIEHLRKHGAWFGEFSNRKKDGTPFITQAGITALEMEGKTYWVCVQEDITDRKRLEAEVQQRIGELAEADRRKDEFLAVLAHELRNPLAPIRNSLQLLALGATNPEMVHQARIMMERQVQHMIRLVDDLLDVSRIMRGKITLRRQWVDLAEVISHAVETARPLIDAAGHTLRISLPAEPVRLPADPIRLAQVVANLLNNAAKYTEPKGLIELQMQRQAEKVVIRVRDSGIGIAPEMLGHIFDQFVQADRGRDRAHGGLGIGLTLVRSLVEMHGGDVEVKSEGPGQGSEFTVRLPLASNPIQDTKTPMTQLSESPAPNGTRRRRILVVDDNVDSAVTLSMLLQMMKQEVRTVHDGRSALDAIAADAPEIVLLDIGMPGMDGYEVARQIRAQGHQGIVLVALTGWGAEDDRRRSEQAGFDLHLVKPVEPDALQSVLSHPKLPTE